MQLASRSGGPCHACGDVVTGVTTVEQDETFEILLEKGFKGNPAPSSQKRTLTRTFFLETKEESVQDKLLTGLRFKVVNNYLQDIT